jgi:hypothetical protein
MDTYTTAPYACVKLLLALNRMPVAKGCAIPAREIDYKAWLAHWPLQ